MLGYVLLWAKEEREDGRMDGSGFELRASKFAPRREEGGPDQKLLMAAFPSARSSNGSSHIPPCINFARILSDPPDHVSRRLASGRDRPADRQNLGASIVHAVKSVM